MTLSCLQKGHSATITAIHADKILKNRFNAFGLTKGSTVYATQYSLAKQTMEIRINKTRMALRLSEAKNIEISA